MIRKILLNIFILIILLFTETMCPVKAVDLDNLASQQKSLEFLKDEDLANIIFFSDYDVDYDRKLYYNPEAREIVNQLYMAEQHFKNSNISVSFHEYRNAVRTMKNNDFYYMLTAYKLSEIGFFSLAHLAMTKVQDMEIWGQHIDFIRKYCFPKTPLKVTEEVFFAGLLSDIIYNNMTDESLLKLEKEGKILADYDYARYIRAKAYFAEKNYKEALNQINKAISENSNNIFYKQTKAEILNACGKENEALGTIRQIQTGNNVIFTSIQKNSDKIKYHALSKTEKNEIKQKYYLACYFYLNKDYQRAINELKLLIMRGENKQSPELLGKIYSITDNQQEALNLYNKQISKNDKCSFAHKGKGDIYLAGKNYGEALSEYKLADKNEKNNVETLCALAVVSGKLQDNKSAEKYIKKLNRISPLNYKVLYLTSKFEQDKGSVNLKKSISQNPLYAGGWLDLTEQALSSRDTDSAEKYINASACITKKDARYFYYKSILNTQKKDYERALSDINRAKEIISERNQKQKTEEQNEQI